MIGLHVSMSGLLRSGCCWFLRGWYGVDVLIKGESIARLRVIYNSVTCKVPVAHVSDRAEIGAASEGSLL